MGSSVKAPSLACQLRGTLRKRKAPSDEPALNAAPAVECVLRAASTLDMRPAKPRFTDDDRPRSDANVTKRPAAGAAACGTAAAPPSAMTLSLCWPTRRKKNKHQSDCWKLLTRPNEIDSNICFPNTSGGRSSNSGRLK